MRSYPANSPQASARILAIILLICQSASNSFQVSASKFFQLLRLI